MIYLRESKASDVWQRERGTWRGVKLTDQAGRRSATASCPDCGQTASLSGHEIAKDGTVNPSVVCPNANCNFHQFVKLEGWTP